MNNHNDEEVTTLDLTFRWVRRVLSWIVSLVAFGVFLVLLIALGLYQFGYRPLATESEEVRLANWGGAEKDRPDRPELRVLSLNLNYGAGEQHLDLEMAKQRVLDRAEVMTRLDQLALEIRSRDVDIIFLQEVDFNSEFAGHFDQAEYLARRLRYGYLARTYSWKHPYAPYPNPLEGPVLGPMEAGMAVIARVPVLTSTRFSLTGATFDDWWRTTFGPTYCLHMVEVALRDQKVQLFQTHLANSRPFDRERQAREVASLIGRESLGKSVLVGTLGAPPPDIRVSKPGLVHDNTIPLIRHRMNFQTLVKDFTLLDDPQYATFDDGDGPQVLDYALAEKGVRIAHLEVVALGGHISPHKALLFDLIL